MGRRISRYRQSAAMLWMWRQGAARHYCHTRNRKSVIECSLHPCPKKLIFIECLTPVTSVLPVIMQITR